MANQFGNKIYSNTTICWSVSWRLMGRLLMLGIDIEIKRDGETKPCMNLWGWLVLQRAQVQLRPLARRQRAPAQAEEGVCPAKLCPWNKIKKIYRIFLSSSQMPVPLQFNISDPEMLQKCHRNAILGLQYFYPYLSSKRKLFIFLCWHVPLRMYIK